MFRKLLPGFLSARPPASSLSPRPSPWAAAPWHLYWRCPSCRGVHSPGTGFSESIQRAEVACQVQHWRSREWALQLISRSFMGRPPKLWSALHCLKVRSLVTVESRIWLALQRGRDLGGPQGFWGHREGCTPLGVAIPSVTTQASLRVETGLGRAPPAWFLTTACPVFRPR